MLPINSASPFTPEATNAARQSSAATSPTTSNPAPSNQLNGNSFLTLLTAQLKSQDPLNPLDPNTFVTELVQFNQLQQLININQTLSSATSGTPPPTSSASQSNLTQAALQAASTAAI